MDEVDISMPEQPKKGAGKYTGKRVAKRKRKRHIWPILLLAVLVGCFVGIRRLAQGFSDYSVSTTILEALPEESTEKTPEPTKQIPQQTPQDIMEQPKLAENEYLEEYYSVENGFIRYESPLIRGKVAVDISSHQGKIDWSAVAAAGVEAAVIRVGYRGYTEGTVQADARFQENLEGAMNAGLDVSVYFFSQAITLEEAQEEATFAVNALKLYPFNGTVYFDWEEIQNDARTDETDPAQLTKLAEIFCSCVETSGYSAGIYFNQTLGYERMDLANLSQYRFWLAEYNDIPTFAHHFDCWQYTNTGTVDGITGNVDMNVMFCQKS